jgi:hypothetical protein
MRMAAGKNDGDPSSILTVAALSLRILQRSLRCPENLYSVIPLFYAFNDPKIAHSAATECL